MAFSKSPERPRVYRRDWRMLIIARVCPSEAVGIFRSSRRFADAEDARDGIRPVCDAEDGPEVALRECSSPE